MSKKISQNGPRKMKLGSENVAKEFNIMHLLRIIYGLQKMFRNYYRELQFRNSMRIYHLCYNASYQRVFMLIFFLFDEYQANFSNYL